MKIHRPSQQGLTLVELMIALTLGLIVIGALAAIFIANNRSYHQNEAIAILQDNARFAMDSLGRDLAMAGYWGGVRTADADINVSVSAATHTPVVVSGDCRPSGATNAWLFDPSAAVVFTDNVAATTTADFPCLSNLQLNSDIVMIRRVSGSEALTLSSGTTTGAVQANRFYLKTNQSVGSLFRQGNDTNFDASGPSDCPDTSGSNAPCSPVSGDDAPLRVYAYTPQIYYVRNYWRTVGDGIPTLCRRWLDDSTASPSMAEDCLVEGVETLQLEWGLSKADGVIYSAAPSAAELGDARSVRLHLLLRSTNNNVQASNDAKTFSFANYPTTTTSGNALRRLFTTTLEIKNLKP